MGRTYSAEEVQRFLGRAIEMEASREELSMGLTRAQVYEIAREVGLDEKYVDQVLNPEASPTPNNLEARAIAIIEREENQKNRVREVNSFLRKAFGIKTFFGRRIPLIQGDIKGNIYPGCNMKDDPSPTNELDHICHWNLGSTFGFMRFIGEFINRDGSHLKIYDPRNLWAVKRYAELYKSKYGKDVQIELTER